tara:strand:- start:325 stop:546 length:222 start_codon:yes stop_codon:yes gene_type:complete
LTFLGFLFLGESITTYRVDGMICEMNCPKKINESLNSMDGIKSCMVDFKTKMATVVYDDEKTGSFWKWLFGKN